MFVRVLRYIYSQLDNIHYIVLACTCTHLAQHATLLCRHTSWDSPLKGALTSWQSTVADFCPVWPLEIPFGSHEYPQKELQSSENEP